ncbi:hypothetical protein ACFR9U_08415 [Halorientalis brevis]|uniref:DUF2795 domain-containing protein n=1 Tax=Halorientalis brevis TaxID=1126241 RepID=A0ABD6CBT6_9EURY|nr:hypothetical protein [Halorientalis brevis]
MSGRETDREEGVDFTDIDPILSELAYPTTKDEFVSEYGDQSIARTNADPISVHELFDGTGEDTFESPTEIRQSVLNLMPRESVGRQRYSDRGGAIPEEGPELTEGANNESL